jgi:membrane protein YqaA with SNARE-associated domain
VAGVLGWFRGLPEKAVVIAGTPWAPYWLFAWAFAESSLFPMPPDVLLAVMGIARPKMAFLYAAICTVGSVLGALLGYALGYFGGRPLALRLIAHHKIDAAERLYQKYDVWAVGLAGFTPIPYKVFTILSGLLEVRLWRFVLASVVSRGARFFLVSTLAFFLGDEVKQRIDGWSFGLITLLVGVGVVVGFIGLGWYARRKRRQNVGDSLPGKAGAGDGAEPGLPSNGPRES